MIFLNKNGQLLKKRLKKQEFLLKKTSNFKIKKLFVIL